MSAFFLSVSTVYAHVLDRSLQDIFVLLAFPVLLFHCVASFIGANWGLVGLGISSSSRRRGRCCLRHGSSTLREPFSWRD